MWILAVLWLWMPALLGLFWVLLAWLAPGVGFRQTMALWLQREVLPDGGPSGWLWVWAAIGLALSAYVLLSEGELVEYEKPATAAGAAVLAALALVLVWLLPAAVWDNDKQAGRYYNSATVFHVPDLNDPPDVLAPLLQGARSGRPGCDRTGRHDVPSCVRADNAFAALRWESRTSSLASARTAMTSAASLVSGVDVMEPTLTYIWGDKPNTGGWSAILDGHGVAQWDGTTNSARVCRYAGDYRLDRYFGGSGKRSLRNLLAERFPRLTYSDDDIWGHCEQDRPVIYIPALRQTGYRGRTVRTAGGVIVVRGTASGRAALSLRAEVRPGELPGPAIAKVLVRAQHRATEWAAGRGARADEFGLVTTSFETQKANPGEYLLRGADRRLYFVTPLVPRGSRSQSFIAYGIAPADETRAGRLNRYDIHVLDRDDPGIVNLAALHAKAVGFVSSEAGGHANFLNSGGRLEQYIPLGGGVWRVYGVQNGQTVFYVDLSATDQFQPRTVRPPTREGPGAATPAPAAPGDCGKPVDQLDDRRLADCLGRFADELRRRSGGS